MISPTEKKIGSFSLRGDLLIESLSTISNLCPNTTLPFSVPAAVEKITMVAKMIATKKLNHAKILSTISKLFSFFLTVFMVIPF